MKTHVLTFAIATLAMGALAGAQTPPSSTTPSESQSSSSTTTQAPSGSYSSSSTDAKAQMKDCIAKQKTMNPQISEADAKKACKTE